MRAYRRWVGVLAMANDENNGAVSIDEDGGERFDADFEPAEPERIDDALEFSRDVLEAAGRDADLLDRPRRDPRAGDAAGWATDPARSVVDAHGESHDVKRLFVGDGSVDPAHPLGQPLADDHGARDQARRAPRRRPDGYLTRGPRRRRWRA